MNPVLEVSDLTVDLQTETQWARAVDALSLCIERGQTFALVGESGCGKSMTALALMRLLPDAGVISHGDVKVQGVQVLDMSEREMQSVRGKRVSIIFQEPATSLNPVMTVGRQIMEVIERHTPLRGVPAQQHALDLITKVGLPEPQRRMQSYPFELSGGQMQRVMIAMALATEPDLLIADEPTTALDVTIQKQILELLQQLQLERGMAMLLITHDLAVVSGMAHHVAMMYAGQIVEVAQATEFFTKPSHPYSRLLLKALPRNGARGQDLQAIHGTVPPLTEAFLGCRFAPRCPWRKEECVERDLKLEAIGATHSVRCLRVQKQDILEFSGVATAVVEEVSQVSQSVILQVKNLQVSYESGHQLLGQKRSFEAVKNVSFDILKGQTLALVGESGCGKTSIGKALLQVLGRSAKIQGDVQLEGQQLLGPAAADMVQIRRRLQIIFQNPFSSLNPKMRVAEILEEGMKSLRPEWSREQRQVELTELMGQVGLRTDALQRYPHEFSGGQRQRIAIARALAVKPQLIVCDEPTSALDVSIQAQILNLLRELQRNLGVSYLFITHNMGVVEYLAHQVAVMQSGKIIEMGSVEDVLMRPKEVYTQTLLKAVPQLKLLAATV